MQRVLDKFEESDLIKSSIVGRSTLPLEVSGRLISMVSEKLGEELMLRHELPSDQVSDLTLQSREKATLGLIGKDNITADFRRLIVHLYQNDRLTPTIMLRAICMGDMDFFEGSLAVRSRIPVSNTREALMQGDRNQISGLLEKAQMPKTLRSAFLTAIQVAGETEYDG